MNSKIALCAWRWSWNRVRSSSSHSTVAKKLLLRSFAGHGVVVTVPDRAHRRCHARLAAAFTEGHRRVLATLVGVMDDRARASLSHRHVQCVEHQFGAQMVGHRTPHHPAAEHIEYDGQVQESRRSRDVGVGSGRSALSSLERWVSPGPALRTGRAALTASGSPCAHAVGYDGRYWPSPNGAASSAWRVPATRPRSGRATKRRYSPATSSPRIDAANTLDPFAMYTAFPCSDYYGSSAPLRRRRPATGLPRRTGRDQRSGSHVPSRTLQRGRCPAMPLQPRHGYAAVLHRGLLADDINRPKSSPPGQAGRVRVATQPPSVRFELVVFS